MIRGPLNQIMSRLNQGEEAWTLVEKEQGLVGWIDVGEAMLIAREVEAWDEFLQRAPQPVQMFLIHLSGQLNDDVGEHLRGLLQLVRSAPFQSQVLEARIRLEQAVLDAAEGRVEQAVERAEWAEVRLSTLGRGGRHHAMAVIVRLNILIRADQGLRALHLCSEITRDGKHDPWTIGHTRLIAGRIMAALGRPDEAIRVTWIALCLLNGVNDQQGAIEAAELLLASAETDKQCDVRLFDRTGLNLDWTYGQDVSPTASSGKVLSMNELGMHKQDYTEVRKFLSQSRD